MFYDFLIKFLPIINLLWKLFPCKVTNNLLKTDILRIYSNNKIYGVPINTFWDN